VARYPVFPLYMTNMETDEVKELYETIQTWAAVLTTELDSRDIGMETTPSTNIYAVTTVTNIGRPRKGDVAYSTSSGKFKGYVSLGAETSWQDLN
jgi:hypothetical protein|tara:strand:+ start:3372 stop:3656 length:285 start_codon:yes stop_codon:yes gene_type:complete